mgnify:CR=1 FL=1
MRPAFLLPAALLLSPLSVHADDADLPPVSEPPEVAEEVLAPVDGLPQTGRVAASRLGGRRGLFS